MCVLKKPTLKKPTFPVAEAVELSEEERRLLSFSRAFFRLALGESEPEDSESESLSESSSESAELLSPTYTRFFFFSIEIDSSKSFNETVDTELPTLLLAEGPEFAMPTFGEAI